MQPLLRRLTLLLAVSALAGGCAGRPPMASTPITAPTPRPVVTTVSPTAAPRPTTSPTQLLVDYLTERVAATPDDAEAQREH